MTSALTERPLLFRKRVPVHYRILASIQRGVHVPGPYRHCENGVLQWYTFFLIFALKHRLWVLVRVPKSGSGVYL